MSEFVNTADDVVASRSAVGSGARIDGRCRPATPFSCGGGPRGIFWLVTGRGAACGGAADRKNTGSDRRRYGVRITTVRTQLGSILRKVGAERQSDLIRILSSTGIGTVSFSAAWSNMAEAVTQMPLWFSGV